MKIAIVSDNKEVLDIMRDYINKSMLVDNICSKMMSSFKFVQKFNQRQIYDIYILDFTSFKEKKINIINKIYEMQRDAHIVIIVENARSMFTKEVCEYVLKNQLEIEIPKMVSKYKKTILLERNSYYKIETKRYYEKIRLEDLIYIYKEGRNAVFVTKEKKYWQRISLREVWERLEGKGFIQIRAAKIVGIHHIVKMIDNYVVLIDDSCHIISREHLKNVKNVIKKYLEENK